MTSKYEKKRKKTRKKMKGGTSDSTSEKNSTDKIIDMIKCYFDITCIPRNFFLGFSKTLEKNVKALNNMLIENGLFLSNVYKLGGESTLKGIIGDVCFDIFDERICETKINHLLYKDKLPDIPQKKNIIQTGSVQTGGANQDANKTSFDDMSIEAKIIYSNNISMDSIDYDKDYIEKYIYNHFRSINLQTLFDILKYIKVLNTIYENTIGEIKKPESNPPINLVTNDKTLMQNTYDEWSLCSNYHQGKIPTDKVTEQIKKKCNMDDRPTMYEQSTMKLTDMNYEPVFTKCFFDIIKVLKEYYTIEYDELDEQNDYFKKANQIKQLDPTLNQQLKEVYKVIKYFKIDEQLSDLFKDKMELLSKEDKDAFLKSLGSQ